MTSSRAGDRRLILASRSPRRRILLQEFGLDFEVLETDTDETHDNSAPVETEVQRIACAKISEALLRVQSFDQRNQATILTADTLVSLQGRHLAKPRDRSEALEMLQAEAGKTLKVATGVAVVSTEQPQIIRSDVAVSFVTMINASRAELMRYVDSGEPLDKAGAFAIQGLGRNLVAKLNGSYSNVVGLPRDLVFHLLRQVGWSFEPDRWATPDNGGNPWQTP